MDPEVAVGVEGPATFCTEKPRGLVSVFGALVLQQLGRPGKRGFAVHTGVQGLKGRRATLLLLHRVYLSVLVVTDLSTGSKGTLEGQTGKGSRELRGVWLAQLRAGQAGADGTVVVVKMVMGARKWRICAVL